MAAGVAAVAEVAEVEAEAVAVGEARVVAARVVAVIAVRVAIAADKQPVITATETRMRVTAWRGPKATRTMLTARRTARSQARSAV
jgi:hypothetical protein